MKYSLLYAWKIMNLIIYNKKISNESIPVLVEFWAPWCAPCKAMTPSLIQSASRFKEKVDLIKINIDENPEIASSEKIMAVPTMIGYFNGKHLFRKTGFQSSENIDKLFSSLSEGRIAQNLGIPVASRILRLVAGTALILAGTILNSSIPLVILGIIVAFSAIYDRCPVYRAVSGWVKSVFTKKVVQ